MNINNLEVIMSFQLFIGSEDVIEKTEYVYYRLLQFYAELQMRLPHYEGQSEILSSYENLAGALYDVIDDFFSGLDNDSTGRGNIPVQPIWYDEPGLLVSKLSGCGKIAYFDKKNNIASLLPFLNDNIDQKAYLSGEDTFFKSIIGWKVELVRDNYAQKRLSRLIISGIYTHWENWFNLVKPRKIFHHYANWTYPRHAAVAKLDFKSKIVTAFYSYGVCIGICLIALAIEILLVGIYRHLLLYFRSHFIQILLNIIVEYE